MIDLSVPLRFGQTLNLGQRDRKIADLWIEMTILERKGQKNRVNKISSVPEQGYSKMLDLRTEKTEKFHWLRSAISNFTLSALLMNDALLKIWGIAENYLNIVNKG